MGIEEMNPEKERFVGFDRFEPGPRAVDGLVTSPLIRLAGIDGARWADGIGGGQECLVERVETPVEAEVASRGKRAHESSGPIARGPESLRHHPDPRGEVVRRSPVHPSKAVSVGIEAGEDRGVTHGGVGGLGESLAKNRSPVREPFEKG